MLVISQCTLITDCEHSLWFLNMQSYGDFGVEPRGLMTKTIAIHCELFGPTPQNKLQSKPPVAKQLQQQSTKSLLKSSAHTFFQ